jgi:hypothetical protein
MANKASFPIILPVRLPEGAREELASLAKRRYTSTCALARQAIMAELERARENTASCPAMSKQRDGEKGHENAASR